MTPGVRRAFALLLAAGAALALAAAARTPARTASRVPARLPAPAPAAHAPLLDAQGYRLAVPPYAFRFPADHASHPGFRTEWWYYTGHLRAGGRSLGYELTFFRVGLPGRRAASPSAWAASDVVFLHLALTDETRGKFHHAEFARRAALGMAGADSTRFSVWLDDAYARLAPDGKTHLVRGRAGDFAIELSMLPQKPPAVHGERGVSQKSEGAGNASHYYSLTRLSTSGRVVIGSDTLAVEGTSWMDHEFASNAMATTHVGWDWFSVQLDDGRELMLYQLRRRDGSIEPLSHGTLVEADGRTRALAAGDFRVRSTGRWHSPHTNADYPAGWVLELPAERLSLSLAPTVADQELEAPSMGGVVYWEGSVRVMGTGGGVRVAGEGYVELTGYGGRAPF